MNEYNPADSKAVTEYEQKLIEETRKEAKLRYEQDKLEREQKRKEEEQKKLEREMLEKETRWKMIEDYCQGFTEKHWEIFNEILREMGASKENPPPISDFTYMLRTPGERAYKLTALWNKLLAIPLEYPSMGFSKVTSYTSGHLQIIPKQDGQGYETRGFGYPATVKTNSKGEPVEIEFGNVPIRLIEGASMKGKIKINI